MRISEFSLEWDSRAVKHHSKTKSKHSIKWTYLCVLREKWGFRLKTFHKVNIFVCVETKTPFFSSTNLSLLYFISSRQLRVCVKEFFVLDWSLLSFLSVSLAGWPDSLFYYHRKKNVCHFSLSTSSRPEAT